MPPLSQNHFKAMAVVLLEMSSMWVLMDHNKEKTREPSLSEPRSQVPNEMYNDPQSLHPKRGVDAAYSQLNKEPLPVFILSMTRMRLAASCLESMNKQKCLKVAYSHHHSLQGEQSSIQMKKTSWATGTSS